MAEAPKVVVITRTRNRPALLRRAMESVLAQTMEDWQHVIVNDGGKKEPLEELVSEKSKAYGDRLKVIHQRNQGMQNAANNGIQQSDSTYLVIHDDDDSWHPDYLKKTTEFLEKAGEDSPYQGVISKTLRILEAEQKDGSFKEVERSPYVPLKEISLFRVGYDNPFSPIAFLYRRKAHDSLGYFEPRWDMVADLDFNFRFLQNFEIGVVDEELAYYHWRDDQAKKANANTVTLQKERHGRYLNELKNHYLRQASNAREAAIALALQVSAFAVENQWMTAEIRERMMEAKLYFESLLKKVDALQEFNSDSLWPKLTEDVITRMGEIQTSLGQFDQVKKQLSAIQTFDADSTWPKLADLSTGIESLQSRIEELIGTQGTAIGESLEKLHAFNGESLWPKLGDVQSLISSQLDELKAVTENSHSQLKELHSFNEKVWPKLNELQEFNSDTLWPKLNELQEFNSDALWPKLVAQTELMEKLMESLGASWNKQVETNGQLDQIREDISSLREDNKRQWQLGRLRLQWLPRRKGKSQADD